MTIRMKQITAPLVILLALSVQSGWTLETTPDQEEQIKLKSAVWMAQDMEAEALTKAKKYAEAEAIYKKIIEDRKGLGLDLFTEYDRLGALYANWGKLKEAEEIYKEMLNHREQKYGNDDLSLIYPLNQYADFLDKRGEKAQAKSMRARAVAIQKEADAIPKFSKMSGAPGSPERIAEAEKMRLLGDKYMLRDLQTKALAYYERAVQLDPKNAKAVLGRGDGYNWFNKFPKAKADYDLAIKLQPNFSKAYVNRAFLMEGAKDRTQAIRDFDKAIEIDPKDTEAMGSRAKLLDVMGKHKEAVEGYTKLIAVNPALYYPYIQRAVAYSDMGKHKEAIDDYTTLINRAPDDYEYYEYRAKEYIKAGELKKALADYDKIVELNPKNSIVYHDRAKLCEKLDGKKSPRVVADYAMAKKLGYSD